MKKELIKMKACNKFIFLMLIIISSVICNNVNANTIIKCSGLKKTIDPMLLVPGGVVENFIEFNISEINGFFVITGANIPYNKFQITTRTDDTLISNTKDQQGYEWLINLNRYSGEINLFRSIKNIIDGSLIVNIILRNGFCQKQEKLM